MIFKMIKKQNTMKQKFLSLIAMLSICTVAMADCPDFTNLYSSYVTAYTGNTSDPFLNQGVVSGRHTLITTQGTDPYTGGALQLLPPGETQTIKLGNEQIGAEAEALNYRFTVDVNNTMLLLKFAVVLEDPDHLYVEQPRFVVRVTDADGNLVEECAEYDVSAGADIPGFQTYQVGFWQTIRWRDWTNMGIDLLKYVGQEVQVQFITYDCSLGAHFGYAYFTASCMSNRLQVDDCLGSDFTLTAPGGFESYLWSDGSTGQTATFNTGNVNNSEISCIVTSAMGCQVTLYAYISTTGGIEPGTFTDTICEGETYTQHGFNLPPQLLGQHFYQIVIVNPADCTDDQEINLYLTVIARYTYFTAAICHGEDYTDNGFNVIQPPPGVWRDTIYTGNIPPGCDVYNVLELTVSDIPIPNLIIEGEVSPCVGELFTYSFAGFETLTYYQWVFPGNAVVVGSIYQPQVTVYFTDNTPGTIVLSGVNGCGSGNATLPVHPRQSYHIQLNEQICMGEVFNQYNFNLGVQNNLGFFVYENHLTSSLGCDSIVLLVLNVLPTPVVHIEPIDPILCNPGDEITLWAVLDDMQYDEVDECAGDYPSDGIYDCDFDYLWNTGSTAGFITENPNGTTTYTVTVTLQSGCSASASQIVLVYSNDPIIIDATICKGETYSAYGITATQTGVYQTIIQTDDCTIDLTVNLTVVEPAEFIISGDICVGERFTGYGFDFTLYQAGLFVDTVLFVSSMGCDSLVIFNLQVLPEKTTTVYDNVCQYETYTGNGFTLPEQIFSGLQTYKKTLPTAQNCDSIVILKLLVHPVDVNTISDIDTIGNYYNKFGFDLGILTEPGIITETFYSQSLNGCDSTVILNLRVVPLPCLDTLMKFSASICEGENYDFYGEMLTEAGEYTKSFLTAAGCDSTFLLTLAVEDFGSYAVVVCNRVILLNLKKLEEDGYDVTGCTWYKNDMEVTDTHTLDKYSFSEGPNKLLEMSPTYYSYRLAIRNQEPLCSTEKIIIRQTKSADCPDIGNSNDLLAYPNPVSSGSVLTVEGVVTGSPLYVYNYFGACVLSMMPTDDVVTLTLNFPPGIYLIRSEDKIVRVMIIKH